MSASRAAAMGARRRIWTRLAAIALASAITSTDAIASDADDQVDPQRSANCTMDFVSRSMKPAPRKKKCHDQPGARADLTDTLENIRVPPPRASHTASADTVST